MAEEQVLQMAAMYKQASAVNYVSDSSISVNDCLVIRPPSSAQFRRVQSATATERSGKLQG